MTPQFAINQSVGVAERISKSLRAYADMLATARPDSSVVNAAVVHFGRMGVELSNASIDLQQALLTGGRADDE